jgi:2-oxo-4-hydroxy-4-carboxy-5-ureidoimidazoline decarboxylase
MSLTAAERLDAMDEAPARTALTRCCGAVRWVEGMLGRRPFGTTEDLHRAADAIWAQMTRADILEAFAHHPRIGANLDALREKYATTSDWAGQEQSSVAAASDEVLVALRDANVEYEARFGHLFIVCATGKSAEEMLAILRRRLDHDHERELAVAAGEQAKITHLRLEKL